MSQRPQPRTTTEGQATGALVLGVESSRGESQRAMEELLQLVRTIGLEPMGVFVQQRAQPHPTTFLGSGKLRQVRGAAVQRGAQVLVFNGELSPRQAAAIAEATDLELLDRTEVILEIFAQHARTREGKLQVQLARLEYMMPRLVGRGKEMSQIAGGRMGGGAVGVRGPGLTALEMDRRKLRRRMHTLQRRLEEIVQHREVERVERQRSGPPLVGLVGYTNAGKSSLLNALAGEEVVVANDRLFETLDTTIRRVDLGERVEALVSDTVGFIDHLPTDLVSAFRATLEEALQADLLCEVLDASDPFLEQHRTVERILKDLGAADKPRLILLNKRDLVPAERLRELRRSLPEALPISALTGEGLDELRAAMRRPLTRELVTLTLHLPYDQLQLMSPPAGQGVLLDTEYEPDHVRARVRVHPRLIERLRPYVVAED